MFRLPTAIAEPLRITTNVYDPDGSACGARGALCSKLVQATNDASGAQGFSATGERGAARNLTFTYNANGSVLTVNGPRTDTADLVTYTYYAEQRSRPRQARQRRHGDQRPRPYDEHHLVQRARPAAHHRRPERPDDRLVYDARLRLTSRRVGSEITALPTTAWGNLRE